MKNPDQIFELCVKTSKVFCLDYKKEYFDIFVSKEKKAADLYTEENLNNYNFKKKFEDSLSFTSLLFCCSVIYIKRIHIDNIVPNPFKDKFDQRIVALIKDKANQLDTYRMQIQLNSYSGCDIDYYTDEFTFEYQCMRYLSLVASNLFKGFGFSTENYLINNLAYNFCCEPGIITYKYLDNIDVSRPPVIELKDKESTEILYDDIKFAIELISPNLK